MTEIKDSNKTIREDWRKDSEWLSVIVNYSTRQFTSYQEPALIQFWKKYPELTLADFEKQFRVYQLPVYFFAEDPSTAIFNRGSKGRHPVTGKETKYFLSKTTQPLEKAKKTFPEEYFDTKRNLERLKDCGFAGLPEEDKFKIVDYILSMVIHSPNTEFILFDLEQAKNFVNEVTKIEVAILERVNVRIMRTEEIRYEIIKHLAVKELSKEVEGYLMWAGWYN